MADAEVYEKTVTDKVVILNTRSKVIQGISAPNWLELRVGFFLSLTDDTADDTITGLSETITGVRDHDDRYWIGLKDRSGSMPKNLNTSFIGFTNAAHAPFETLGDSVLSSSDIGLGTTNTNFWRPNNSRHNWWSFLLTDGRTNIAGGGSAANALAQHFPQDTTGAGGYCVLLGIRIMRDNINSKTVTAQVKSNVHSADMLYTSIPDNDLLRTTLSAQWPTSQNFGPFEFTILPSALFLYWPFRNSRLRIHAMGFIRI